jgi:FMN-dependent oxidoreductase (nitrilotriacetate monooxygenase family)
VRDVANGIYLDPDRMHVLDHKGAQLSVRGPLNIARSPQGWPVIFQAGASEVGRQLAAETAEAIFGAQDTFENGKAFYADIKARVDAIGRDRDSIKILPAALVIVGDTVAEAKIKRAKLDSLIHYESAIGTLSEQLGTDASGFVPDAPLPPIPETNNSKTTRERAIEIAEREGLTVRQLAQRLAGFGGLILVGTPQTIVDEMEIWFENRASDGFNIMFPYLPDGLDDFVGQVIPELQRRSLFRRKYAGSTLRGHLGLTRPANRFFPT